MKVSIEFDDYDPQDPDIEFRKNRWNYWNVLKNVRAEYLETFEQGARLLQTLNFNYPDFSEYVETRYGIKMHIVDGSITDKYDIVDEKLYTFFMLKHP
jgi:hypothetical protein